MTDDSMQIEQLLEKLEILQKKQNVFAQEMNQLQIELNRLKADKLRQQEMIPIVEEALPEYDQPIEELEILEKYPELSEPAFSREQQKSYNSDEEEEEPESNLEKFIGENLINKIGIAITIIGVAIGVKYSIDHELISPLARIILGYAAGLTLLFFGVRLKSNYENYSAVLVSGSMAILYFITYAAFTFFGLFPQWVAFLLMVIITCCTVYAAWNFDNQVIALIGLVGAYAVPFLLSTESGEARILFSYVAIINAGILVVSVKKYWEPLFYASFVLTWMIFFVWYNSQYVSDKDFGLALVFLALYFGIFYFTFLVYKVTRKQRFDLSDILLLLVNSSVFYGVGYSILNGVSEWKESLGLFTLLNAIVHFLVGLLVYFRRNEDQNMLNFIFGLAVIFITMAVPVQLDGNWVTVLWAGEMALLFWIGRTQKAMVFEILSYPMILLTFLSLLHSWSEGYFNFERDKMVLMTPLFNVCFLTSVWVILSFGILYFIDKSEKFPSVIPDQEDFVRFVSILIPSILLFTTYLSFRNEIAFYWDQLYVSSVVKMTGSWNKYYTDFFISDLKHFKTLWIINYSMLFFSLLSLLNIYKLKERLLGLVTLFFNLAVISLFLTLGLYVLGGTPHALSQNSLSANLYHSFFNLWIRYISFGFLALILFISHRYIKQDFLRRQFRMEFDFLFFVSVLTVSSSELIKWMNVAESAESYKLGLSILWGVYSLVLISLGIWKKKKYLRIGAIALFAVTLIKLFFYDLSSLDTISKTIVFVSLGVLLLIISFIYNKYKNIISE